MKCEMARDNVILAYYGELPDELSGALEQHLISCEECREELSGLREWNRRWPDFRSWNQLRISWLNRGCGSTMLSMPSSSRIPDALQNKLLHLDGTCPQRSRSGHPSGRCGLYRRQLPNRYQVAHLPVPHQGPTYTNPTQSVISSVTGIERTPNTDLVQVHYNRVVPETVEGSLDSQGYSRSFDEGYLGLG